MKVLFVAAEGVPFVKTGGLGDVIGSLPNELKNQDVEVGVMMPKYGAIPGYFRQQMNTIKKITISLGWRQQYCGIELMEYQGIPYYFIDNEYYFDRHGTYGHYDDGERFSFFCRAVLASLPHLDFSPDIIHCHDWHTGMIAPLWHAHYRWYPDYYHLSFVYTIHNLKYQGVFPKQVMSELLGLNVEYFSPEGIEFYGKVNFMKGGISYSHRLTTVSETYAQEIQHPYYGEMLDGMLRKKQSVLQGIPNGIDATVYNPATDEHILVPFQRNQLQGKAENKVQLQQQLGLAVNDQVPMIAIISRLVSQKGLDLVQEVLEELLTKQDVQVVVLGTGEQHYQDFFVHLAYKYGDKLAACICYHEELAHRIYASADMFLMPSRFEPCGLGQMMAMAYGTIPLVRETGGLKDTVIPYNEHTGQGNGFTFTNYNAHDMLYTINRALYFYRQPHHWDKLIDQAMAQDNSWQNSAARYRTLYQELLAEKTTLIGGLA